MNDVYFIYILASRRNGTLYIGSTNDLVRRGYEHRTHARPGFTSRYGVYRLVHFEQFGEITRAIQRERTLKHWSRGWKISLIEQNNPDWRDLYEGIATKSEYLHPTTSSSPDLIRGPIAPMETTHYAKVRIRPPT